MSGISRDVPADISDLAAEFGSILQVAHDNRRRPQR
jgi:hypothetical protein